MDVDSRNMEILRWENLTRAEQMDVARPLPLQAGEDFIRTYNIGGKRIFWTHGISVNPRTGQLEGRGLISLELVLLDMIGIDLAANKYSINETIRLLIRTLFPFLVIFIFSTLYKHTAKEAAVLDRFYVKMKTKVRENREADRRELEISYADPSRFDHRKMFPNTQWEMLTWSREDHVGFWLAMVMVFGIIALLYLLVNLGGAIGS